VGGSGYTFLTMRTGEKYRGKSIGAKLTRLEKRERQKNGKGAALEWRNDCGGWGGVLKPRTQKGAKQKSRKQNAIIFIFVGMKIGEGGYAYTRTKRRVISERTVRNTDWGTNQSHMTNK